MLDVAAVLDLYDRHERRPTRVEGMEREETARTLRFVHRTDGTGWIAHSALDEACADEAIAAEIERFREAGQAFEWKLHHADCPRDLAARLAAHGFAPEPEEALVAFDLGGALPAVPAGVDVRLVESPEDFAATQRVRLAAFGRDLPWQTEALRSEQARAPDVLRIHLALVDGEPAAAGWSRLKPATPFATLWGGGTAPALRRRGAYRALVARRLEEARERGYRYALVDAGPNSLPILERLGFVCIERMTPMVWRP